jgi:predicted nucleotidyltransferase component of viral defense system
MGKKAKPKLSMQADLDRQERIKKLVIIALFSDDDLMNRFVLKGGNALDIVYNVSTRASADVDVSMEDDFEPGRLQEIRLRIEKNLRMTFRPEGYEPFDVTLQPRPEHSAPDQKTFWGGYRMEFKLIEEARLTKFSHDLASMQRNAITLGNKGKIKVDISKFEYTAKKTQREIEGITIYVYTPEMMVAEKLRAICQQIPEYARTMKKHPTPRARDFVDIHLLVDRFGIDMTSDENRNLLLDVFKAKEVPARLLATISNYRSFHQADFEAVKDTVKPGLKLQEFDFYFENVLQLCDQLKALWNE